MVSNIVSYTTSSGNGGSIYIPTPTGISSGNILLLCVRNDSTGSPAVPSGFTLLGDASTIFTYTNTFYGGYLCYKQSDGVESTGISINIESGKFISYMANVNSTGIVEYRGFNDNINQSIAYVHGCKLPTDSGLVINIIGGLSPMAGATSLKVEDVPFNGVFHSGVSFYLSTGIYSSGYSPNYILNRPTGYPYLNSGYLEQFPPALFSFGYSIAFG